MRRSVTSPTYTYVAPYTWWPAPYPEPHDCPGRLVRCPDCGQLVRAQPYCPRITWGSSAAGGGVGGFAGSSTTVACSSHA